MFIVNHESNRISPVKNKSFSEMGFSERKHLQEWLAHQPSALGEDLLIIQKEFDGFDDTRERLDLLALDKDGNLVIIENKLDDSGRDVTWQALKYASYCASLSKGQIVDIFQQYIQRYGESSKGTAALRICEFLDAPDLDEVNLNMGYSQRIMLVAANFRKEVTSTALWLLGQGINVQCIKVEPFSLGDQLLINISQIIPPPEVKELMIGINAKEAEEKTTEVVLKKRHNVRLEYWEKALESLQSSSCNLFDNISPSKDHWLSAGSGLRNCPFNMIFNKTEIRIELWISRPSQEVNKFIFDQLLVHKDAIESIFDSPLEWMRLDDKKACRIQFAKSIDAFDRDNWSEMVEWHIDNLIRFEAAFKDHLISASKLLKKQTDLG
jgi:hypothetical protein